MRYQAIHFRARLKSGRELDFVTDTMASARAYAARIAALNDQEIVSVEVIAPDAYQPCNESIPTPEIPDAT
jgi:hypothetical protein